MNNTKNKPSYSVLNHIAYVIVAAVVWVVAKILFSLSLEIDAEVLKWKKSKKPFVILCAHPSEFDAVVLLLAAFPNKVRFVAGAQQLYKGLQGKILRLLGVIPKKQFTTDITCIKEMMQTVKNGQILAFMPEGRVSIDGCESPEDISTAKLLKKMGVPVALLIPKGTFFVKPSYNWKALIKGKVFGKMTALFDEQSLKDLSNEEILDILSNEIKYDESRYVKEKGLTYGNDKDGYMEGVSKLFYYCPSCKRLYTIKEDKEKLTCISCQSTFKKTNKMMFECEENLPSSISLWNKEQLSFETSFWDDPGAKLEFTVSKYIMTLGVDEDYRLSGKGQLSLDREGFHYIDDKESISTPIDVIPGVSADYMNGYITYYSGNDIRRFALANPQNTARFINSLMTLKKLLH